MRRRPCPPERRADLERRRDELRRYLGWPEPLPEEKPTMDEKKE